MKQATTHSNSGRRAWAAVTKYHRLGGLQETDVSRAGFSRRFQGRSLPHLFQLLEVWCSSAYGCIAPVCFHLHSVLPLGLGLPVLHKDTCHWL